MIAVKIGATIIFLALALAAIGGESAGFRVAMTGGVIMTGGLIWEIWAS